MQGVRISPLLYWPNITPFRLLWRSLRSQSPSATSFRWFFPSLHPFKYFSFHPLFVPRSISYCSFADLFFVLQAFPGIQNDQQCFRHRRAVLAGLGLSSTVLAESSLSAPSKTGRPSLLSLPSFLQNTLQLRLFFRSRPYYHYERAVFFHTENAVNNNNSASSL